MAEPIGTVENSSVLIINHPPSSVMRDWSFYAHRTTQCHSKYGWKITPNSLPSKWTQSRRGLEFFYLHLGTTGLSMLKSSTLSVYNIIVQFNSIVLCIVHD